MIITAAQISHLYLYLCRGPHSPGLILAMVGPVWSVRMPKETAATCGQRERGGQGDTRQEFQAEWNFRGPWVPHLLQVAFEATPATAGCWRPLVDGGAGIHTLDLLPLTFQGIASPGKLRPAFQPRHHCPGPSSASPSSTSPRCRFPFPLQPFPACSVDLSVPRGTRLGCKTDCDSLVRRKTVPELLP